METGSTQNSRGVSIGAMGASEPAGVSGSMDPGEDKGKESFQTAGSNVAAAKTSVSYRPGPANPEPSFRPPPLRWMVAMPRWSSVSISALDCKPNITNLLKVCKTALINKVDDYLEQ